MLRHHLVGNDDWFIVVARQAGRVVAIVPMVSVRVRRLGCTVTTLQPVQQLSGTHGDLLVEDSTGTVLRACVAALRDISWDIVRVNRALEGEPVAIDLEAAMSEVFPSDGWFSAPSYHLRLPHAYEQYLAARSGKFRNYLRRAEKKVAAAGRCIFERTERGARTEEAFAELLSIERASWKHAHGTAISAIPHQEGFYGELIGQGLPAGWVHLTFLRVNGAPVAYNLGVVHGGCYFYLKTSFRDDGRALGIASVARARLIESLIGDGVRAMDFAGEPYEWEQQWASEVRWHRSIVAYNWTVVGQALRALGAVRQRLGGRQGRNRVVFDDPRSLRAPPSGRS